MGVVTDSQFKGQDDTSGITGGLRFETGNNRIIGRNPSNVPRLVLRADGEDFSLKMSKPGFDVLEATDEELIFNSDQNVFKIVGKYSHTITPGTVGASGTITDGAVISHTLGYAPIVNAYATLSGLGLAGGVYTNVGNIKASLPRSFETLAESGLALITTSGAGAITKWVIDCFASADKIYLSWVFQNNASGSSTITPIPVTIYLLQESAD